MSRLLDDKSPLVLLKRVVKYFMTTWLWQVSTTRGHLRLQFTTPSCTMDLLYRCRFQSLYLLSYLTDFRIFRIQLCWQERGSVPSLFHRFNLRSSSLLWSVPANQSYCSETINILGI